MRPAKIRITAPTFWITMTSKMDENRLVKTPINVKDKVSPIALARGPHFEESVALRKTIGIRGSTQGASKLKSPAENPSPY